MKKNLLIESESIKGLNYLIRNLKLSNKIDLVYIDPPFSTKNDFIISDKRVSTISRKKIGKIAYSDKLSGKKYLNFIKENLILIHKLLSERGSIYFHIDYKVGHKIKIMLDEVFSEKNFRNDITRIKCNPKNFKRLGYSNIKDCILFYSKTDNPIWNEPKKKHSPEQIRNLFKKIDKDGRRYTTVPLHAPGENAQHENKTFQGLQPPEGRHWRASVEKIEEWNNEGLIEWSKTGNPRKKFYEDESDGVRYQDIWEFKDPQYPKYPTEKNSSLLDLIINTSSNKNSIILDCFCGSGTTLKSAQMLNRSWIGIDQSKEAIKQTKLKINQIESDLFLNAGNFEFINL